MTRIGFYPPTGDSGELVDSLSDLPSTAECIDYNEFFRLYKDEDEILYVYRVKRPKSPVMERIKEESNG